MSKDNVHFCRKSINFFERKTPLIDKDFPDRYTEKRNVIFGKVRDRVYELVK